MELDNINGRAIVYLTTMDDSCFPRNQIFTSEEEADSFIQDYFKMVLQDEKTPNFYKKKDIDDSVMYFTKEGQGLESWFATIEQMFLNPKFGEV